jgi:replicative DNA helicase
VSTKQAPPYDLELERAVLGACMTDPRALSEVLARLAPRDFYSEVHRRVYLAIQGAASEGAEIDHLAVTNRLKDSASVGKMDARALVFELVESVPVSSGVVRWCEGVKKASRARAVLDAADRIKEKCHSWDYEDAPSFALAAMEEIARDSSDKGASTYGDALAEFDALVSMRRKQEGVTGIRTGLSKMDKALGGLNPGISYIIAARPGIGKCHARGTEVLTPRGPVEIQSLKVGEEVYGYDADGQVRPTRVNAVFPTGYQLVTNITHRGRVIARSTRSHRWLTRYPERGPALRTTADLHIQDRRIVRAFVRTPLGEVHEPHAYAIGAMLGDGCCKQWSDKTLYMSSEDDVIPSKVAAILGTNLIRNHETNFTWALDKRPELSDRRKGQWRSWPDVHLNHAEKLRGKGAADKAFPLEVLDEWNRDSLLAFVAGLIDTDGSVLLSNGGRKLTIKFDSTSGELIDAYRYAIYRLFQTKPGVIKGKRQKSQQWIASIGCTSSSVRILEELDPHLATARKKYKPQYAELYSYTKDDQLGVSLGETEMTETWDIEVDNETHLYLLANEGLVTHNSLVIGQIAQTAANQGFRVLLQTPEMSAVQYLDRLAHSIADVDYEMAQEGKMTQSQEEAVKGAARVLAKLPVYVDDHGSQTPSRIRANVMRYKPDLLLVDYLQYVSPDIPNASRNQEVGAISRALTRIKSDFHIPVVLAAQLNRQLEARHDKRPNLADLRDSGEIEQDADAVMFLHRPGRWDESAPQDELEIHCVKWRFGSLWETTLYLKPGQNWLTNRRGEVA